MINTMNKLKYKICRFWNTFKNLRVIQIIYQIKIRLLAYEYKKTDIDVIPQCCILTPICKLKSLIDDSYSFLNIQIINNLNWTNLSNGMLWAYNLNYMDYLLQEDMSYEKGGKLIDKFIDDLPLNKVGLDPYPIALRGINWIKFICKYRNKIPHDRLKVWNNSLYSQYKLLDKKLEYHLLGNHLLEDAYSLYIASIYFSDERLYEKTSKLLKEELNEQILSDGSHYEQSPMYHCILLDRLLDCYNISIHNVRFDRQKDFNLFLLEKAKLMLGHLSAIIYNDKTIPLLNDSANGVAPTTEELFKYAKRLSIEWDKISLGDCGYRRIYLNGIECILDIGNIKASYQPGHSHADTFNYELRVKGIPFIVDTGISTYNKNERRQYERSTIAHNTVSIGGKDSSEVWGGFRVGKRASVSINFDSENYISATHDGFGKSKLHTRIFQLDKDSICITDKISCNDEGISYIHFSPRVEIYGYDTGIIKTNIATIEIRGANLVDVVSGKASTQYNIFEGIKIAKLYFNKELEYKIKI